VDPRRTHRTDASAVTEAAAPASRPRQQLGHKLAAVTDRDRRPVDQSAIAMIQTQIALGSGDDNLDHLGEASSIHLLAVGGVGRLISDDHGARAVARHQYHVRASSTVGVLSELLARGEVMAETVDLYLGTLRANKRMHVTLGSRDLLRRDLGPWE
jgi:predicted nucleic acid-binding protein